MQDCAFNPTMQSQEPQTKSSQDSKNKLEPNQSIWSNVQDLRERLIPMGQLGCKF
jgi:hypothetical protein